MFGKKANILYQKFFLFVSNTTQHYIVCILCLYMLLCVCMFMYVLLVFLYIYIYIYMCVCVNNGNRKSLLNQNILT